MVYGAGERILRRARACLQAGEDPRHGFVPGGTGFELQVVQFRFEACRWRDYMHVQVTNAVERWPVEPHPA